MKFALISFLFCFSLTLSAQSDTTTGGFKSWADKTQSSVTGSFGAVGTFYSVNGIDARRDPFFWQTNANIQINSNGISIPFSAVFSQQQRTFTQPFNQFGLSPNYKAFTVHMGYRSMRFSDLSLNGNQFLGLGVEYKPENGLITLKALYGRFMKAVDGYYSDGLVLGTPSYERWGYGANAILGTGKNNIGFVFFRASDDPNSITDFQDDVSVKPEQNVIFGITTTQRLSETLKLDAEIDWSAYTTDLRVEESVLEGYSFINNLGSLFYANTTSSFNKAINANLSYTKKKFNLKLGYKRIDPDYKTMGSVYLNNDFENITLKSAFKFLKNKISLSVTGGLQRDNLDKSQVTQMVRLIGSTSLSYVPNQKWTFGAGYSNYSTQSSMSLVSTSLVADTLKYAQVTKSGNLQATRNFVLGKNRGAIQSSATYQNALINQELNSEFLGGNVGINYSITKSKITMALSVSVNHNTTETINLLAIGPNASIGKVLLKNKLTLSLASSVLQSYSYGTDSGLIINGKMGAKYKINRAHSFYSNIGLAKRTDPTKSYTEFIGTIGYKYNFQLP